MGERTSALVSSRTAASSLTAAPRHNLVANSEALAWGANNDSFGIPDVPLVYQRATLPIEPRNIADLVAQSRSGQEWEKIAKLATHQPVYKLPEGSFPEPYKDETGAAMAHAAALTLTDERPVANCCPCHPCNLL